MESACNRGSNQRAKIGTSRRLRPYWVGCTTRPDATHGLGDKRDIGSLPGSADDGREIEEIAIVRIVVVGKAQPDRAPMAGRSVVIVCVVQREHHLDEGPG